MNYTKSTNFASKDSLASGNPLKIVKGTEIDTEFNNIATAIATKADLVSPALTGTPTAPTAAAGTVSTQIATTAFAAQAAYPVGSIYMNASSSTNPATLFGFGTWTAFGTGRMLVGYSSGDSLFGTVGNTGGSRDSTLPSHTHTITDPGHSHAPPSGLNGPWLSNSFSGDGAIDSSTTTGPNEKNPATGNTQSATTGISINSAGTSATNANLPPYITVYMWQRTA